ncbi:MFS transporter [Mycolicibacterium duvalii]|uniref:MFS transporter n=1 Tax=Mycolicibacterium duvalii TaxID=39688 RepID=A0A7I7JZG8_9MYCO|nr:MFS transporter [Mycolicibacterium duvalii]MCV7365916.1 MFS transporter [Mycolicibacterium duvalii]PEG35536.1 MFS transporter [Mycolicibacterium duvalii]BBX16482.1 MFS transporter [Mycolicibacterium duvalii]
MAPERPGAGEARTRRARIAIAAVFLTNGALFANLLPRYPEIKADLAMSNVLYGAAVASFSAGALLAGLTAATLIRRFGSAPVALVTTYLLAAFMVVAAAAPAPLWFAGALFLAGASDAVTDVAQNTNGLRLQREYGRSIINSLHAVWAVGAILGGLMGTAAIALDIGRTPHLAVAAAVFCAVVTVAYRHLLDDPDHARHPFAEPAGGRGAGAVYLALLAFVAIAIAGVTVEDAGNTWATLYLRDSLGAPAAVAPLGYVALVTFMFLGRLAGDRLVDRFGERAVTRVGGLITALGMGLALLLESVPVTIAGFAVAGLGVATVVPAAMRAADELPGLRAGTGLTVLSWLMRAGLLGAPLLVGVIADATSLRLGLLTVPVAGLALVALAGTLAERARR